MRKWLALGLLSLAGAVEAQPLTGGLLGRGASYSSFVTPSGCTTGSVATFLGSLTCVPGLTYAGGVLSVPGAVRAQNFTAIPLPAAGAVTVTPKLSQLGGITVVAGSLLADGDALSVGDGTGVVPIEFDASPGDGTTGGAVPIIFDGSETATQIRDAVRAILDGSGRDWTTSAQAANGIGLVRATPGATGGAIAEDVAAAGFSVTNWTPPTAATTYTYSLQACLPDGACTAAGAASSTAAGVLTLSAFNLNRLSWSAVSGAASYKIRRDVGGATQGVIWSGTALAVDDTGLAGDSSAKPLTDGTGTVTGKVPGVGGTLKVCASNAKFTTGCDFICDGTADQVEIQAAIDALPATGGSVVLSDGTFNTSAAILTRYGLTLSGQGKSTIVYAVSGASRNIITAKNDAGLKGVTAGNDLTVSDLILDGGGLTEIIPVRLWGYAGRIQNPRVLRVSIRNAIGTSYGIMTQYANNLQVTESSFATMGDSLVELRWTKGATFVNNTFLTGSFQTYTSAGDGGVVMTGNSFSNTSITFTNNGGVGSGFVFSGNYFSVTGDVCIAPREFTGVSIVGNVFDATGLAYANGNGFVSVIASTNVAAEVVIADNVFRQGAVAAGATGYPAIVVTGGNGVSISGNSIFCPGTTDSMGVKVNGAATGLTIRNNRFRGAGAGASRVGIYLATVTGAHIEGNRFETLEYGLYIRNTVTGTRVVGPLWTTSVTTPIFDAGTATRHHGVSSLLLTYADNAAALAGGLVAGDPYRTSTGMLMVTY